jgi:hypothetical protein
LKEAETEIGNFYGPLCALIGAHVAIYNNLIIPEESPEQRHSIAESLLVPVDEQIEQTILKSGVSIDDDKIRTIVHQLLVHTEASKFKKAESDKAEHDKAGQTSAGKVTLKKDLTKFSSDKDIKTIGQKLGELHEKQRYFQLPWGVLSSSPNPGTAVDCEGDQTGSPVAQKSTGFSRVGGDVLNSIIAVAAFGTCILWPPAKARSVVTSCMQI